MSARAHAASPIHNIKLPLLHTYGLYSYDLYSYGLYRDGLYRDGLYSYDLDSHSLYSCGLYSYGLYSYDPIYLWPTDQFPNLVIELRYLVLR